MLWDPRLCLIGAAWLDFAFILKWTESSRLSDPDHPPHPPPAQMASTSKVCPSLKSVKPGAQTKEGPFCKQMSQGLFSPVSNWNAY